MPVPISESDILVVDDDEGLLLLIADALRNEGHAVTLAHSGALAVASLRQHRPDLMLLDLQLKDMSGILLLEQVKQAGLAVPFVVVTGRGDEKVAVEMMKQGALDYVMKDAAILELLPVVVKRTLEALKTDRLLASSQQERRRLEKEILDVSERERQRIGADLHDGLGQQLTAIELMCVGLKDDVGALDQELGKQLTRITGLLRESIAQARSLARGLAPLDEQPDAFQSGLAELAERTHSLGRLRCRIESLSSRPLGDRTAAGHLFRIAQEALNNAIKHSGATEVIVRWQDTQDAFRLEIADDGKGMSKKEARGMGLGIMSYRAGIIGATLTVESKLNKGTRVVCVLPRNS